MSINTTNIQDVRSVIIYWNKTVTVGTFHWQTPINIPFVPDLACVRTLSTITTNTANVWIVNSNLDKYGDPIAIFRNNVSGINEHYFIPNLSTVRGGVASFDLVWGTLVDQSQLLIAPTSNVPVSIAMEIEFYTFKK